MRTVSIPLTLILNGEGTHVNVNSTSAPHLQIWRISEPGKVRWELGNYVVLVCEVSSKMTVQQSGLTGLVHDAMRQPPLLPVPVRGFIVFILLGMNAPPRVESDLSSLNE